MPMKLFRNVRVVVNLNSGLFTFPESQERAGKLVIEGCRGNETVLPNFDQAVLNAQRVVRSLTCLFRSLYGSLRVSFREGINAAVAAANLRKLRWVVEDECTLCLLSLSCTRGTISQVGIDYRYRFVLCCSCD